MRELRATARLGGVKVERSCDVGEVGELIGLRRRVQHNQNSTNKGASLDSSVAILHKTWLLHVNNTAWTSLPNLPYKHYSLTLQLSAILLKTALYVYY